MIKRLYNLIIGNFLRLLGWGESKNGKALLEVERERLSKAVATYNQNLAKQAGLVSALQRQISQDKEIISNAKAKVATYAKASKEAELKGDANKAKQLLDMARAEASKVAEREPSLKQNETQAALAEQTFQETTKARDVAFKAAQDNLKQTERLLNERETKTAQAELTEMANSMIGNANSINSGGEALSRLKEQAQKDIDMQDGRLRVARGSIDMTNIEAQKAAMDAEADVALDKILAEQGINLGGEASAPIKVIGETTA